MEEELKPVPEGTANRLRALDEKYFCFYRRKSLVKRGGIQVLTMREQVNCCCQFHNIQFVYYSN